MGQGHHAHENGWPAWMHVLEEKMLRAAFALLLLLLASHVARADVTAVRAGDALVLSNSLIRVRLDLSKGGCPTEVALATEKTSLCGTASLSLYYEGEKRWVTDSSIAGATAKIERRPENAGGGIVVQVDLPAFPGWDLRKSYTLREGSPILSVAYRMRVREALRPYPFIPVNLVGSASADTLLAEGGAVSRDELPVSDFALVMNESPWYAFAKGADGPGVAVALSKWPEWYRRHTIGRRKDGTLFLHARGFPEAFTPGQEVEFSYHLVAFEKEGRRAVAPARALGVAAVPPFEGGAAAPGAASETLARLTQGVRTLCVPQVSTAPVLDGVLDDPCWTVAAVADQFVRSNGSALAATETVGRVVYDADALYIGIRCAEPLMANLVTNSREPGPNVWQDDCVEVRLDPRRDRKTSLQFIVNALGVRQDNLLGEGGLTRTRWSAGAHRGADFWSVEIRIPWADLDVTPPRPGDAWGFNLNRERRPVRETTGWCATPAGFHQAERYGDLLFGRGEVEVTRVEPGIDRDGKGIRVYLRSRRAEAVTVTASVAIARDGKTPVFARGEVSVPPKGEATLTLPFEVREAGTYRVAVTLAALGEIFYAVPFTGTLWAEGLNSVLWPAEEHDQTLYLARETLQHFFFIPANHSQKAYPAFDFVLLLPEGVEFVDCVPKGSRNYHKARRIDVGREVRDGVTYQRVVITSDRALGPSRLEKLRFFNGYLGALRATPRLAGEKHRLFYYLQAPGEREREHALDLVVLPAPEGRQPREIPVGVSLWTIAATDPFWRGLMETYRRCGINSVESGKMGAEPDAARVAREHGMRPWMLLWWSWWNEEYLKQHPDAAVVKRDGRRDAKMVCPEVVADPRSDAITAPLAGYVDAAKAGACEVIWWDLEGPGAFEVCFCARCLERFRRENGIAAGEELTPLVIQTRYASQWTAFACAQSARIAARIRQHAREKNAPLRLAVYSGVQNEHTRRDYRVDWTTLAPHLDIATPSFYSFGAGGLADQFTRGIRETVKGIKEVHEIPVFATLTTGYEGSSLTRDARATRMQILKAIAHGADGVYFWWWGTNDGRHYRAIADASRVIAELEPFFLKGTNDDGLVTVEPSAGASHACWRLGNEVAVLLFNHRGDAAQALRVAPGSLPEPGEWRVVRASPDLEKPAWGPGGLSVAVPALDAVWLVLAR